MAKVVIDQALILGKLFVDEKSADYKFERGDDFHVAWIMGGKVLSVEYIPANWPWLTVWTSSLQEYKTEILKTLKEIGFEKI